MLHSNRCNCIATIKSIINKTCEKEKTNLTCVYEESIKLPHCQNIRFEVEVIFSHSKSAIITNYLNFWLILIYNKIKRFILQ